MLMELEGIFGRRLFVNTNDITSIKKRLFFKGSVICMRNKDRIIVRATGRDIIGGIVEAYKQQAAK